MSRCAAATLEPRPGQPAGSRCREWDGREPGWADAGGPLCATELVIGEEATRRLVTRYLDLAQMAPRTLSQALDTQPGGKPGPPVPISLAPEALQKQIVHVLTTWEEIVREACRLTPAPADRTRDGAAVQRAVNILAPRMLELSKLTPRPVYPTGCDDDITDMAGWEAVIALARLDARAKAMLGWTRRTTKVPGSCSYPDPVDDEKTCGGDLYRDEPRYEGDPCDVYCGRCVKGRWPQAQYEQYVGFMLALPTKERVAA